MNRWTAIFLVPLLLVLLASACSPASTPAAAQPTVAPYKGGARMDVDKRLVDFGRAPYDRLLMARFIVKNVGDQPLVLQKVSLKLVQGC